MTVYINAYSLVLTIRTLLVRSRVVFILKS